MKKQNICVKQSAMPYHGRIKSNTMKSSNKNKLLVIPFVALFAMLLGVLGASAAIDCNLTVPASNGVIQSNTQLNVTYNVSPGMTNNVSVAFEAKAVNTVITSSYLNVNSSYVVIANVTNISNLRHTNLTFSDKYAFADGTYTFRATCILNASTSSGGQHTGISSEVTAVIDRTTPTCVFDSALKSSYTYAPNQKWLVTCANAVSATLQFGSNSLLTMSKVVDACSFTGDKGKVPQSAYSTLIASITDGYNTTTCQLTSIRIDSGAPLKEVAAIVASQSAARKAAESQQQSAGTGGNNNLVLIIIIGLAAWWYVRRKKSK